MSYQLSNFLYNLFYNPRKSQKVQKSQQKKDLPEGKTWFIPDPNGQWKIVHSNEVCPSGLEYRMNMQTGTNEARTLSRKGIEPLSSAV